MVVAEVVACHRDFVIVVAVLVYDLSDRGIAMWDQLIFSEYILAGSNRQSLRKMRCGLHHSRKTGSPVADLNPARAGDRLLSAHYQQILNGRRSHRVRCEDDALAAVRDSPCLIDTKRIKPIV